MLSVEEDKTMDEVLEFLRLMGISEDDALEGLISHFGPTQPGVLRDVWKKRPGYGGKAPTAPQIWELWVKADFRCVKCRSQRRITLDHIDGNCANHSLDNLQVLCYDCNRAKSRRPTVNHKAQLRLYRSTMKLYRQSGQFPTYKEIRIDSGVRDIKGAIYMLRYLEQRLRQHSEAEGGLT
jgi:hypothetical protein